MTYVNRGRDISVMIQKGGEQGIVKALIKLAEEQGHLNDRLSDIERLLNSIVEQVTNNHLVNAKLVQEHEKLKRKFYPNNEGNQENGNEFTV
jgi:hypothetical protein